MSPFYVPAGGPAELGSDPVVWHAQDAAVAARVLVPVVCYSLVMLASHAHRHVPGFVPERAPTPSPTVRRPMERLRRCLPQPGQVVLQVLDFLLQVAQTPGAPRVLHLRPLQVLG